MSGMIIARRTLLRGLFAMPAIIAVDRLMKVYSPKRIIPVYSDGTNWLTFDTNGSLPTGLEKHTPYYVVGEMLDSNTILHQ